MKRILHIPLALLIALALFTGGVYAQSPAVFQSIVVRTLNVLGVTTFTGTTAHTGAATFASTVNVTGATTLGALSASTAAVSGAATFSSTVTATGDIATRANMFVDDFLYSTQKSAQTVVYQGVITPTGTYMQITATAARGTRLVLTTTMPTGSIVNLVNVGAQTITLTDTAPLILSGNIALGQNDAITLLHNGTGWVQVSTSNN